MVALDGEKLWDVFLVLFGIAASKLVDALTERDEKTPPTGKREES